VLFLGTGTSHGVPMIACDCDVCRSTDPRDRRSRPSIFIETDAGARLLVDTTPDLRTQALTHGLRGVDAVLLTHAHADHVMGLDDVRRFNVVSRTPLPIYAQSETLEEVRTTFRYAFAARAAKGGGVPDLRLCPLGGAFCLGGQEIVPIPVEHGPWSVLGFRLGPVAYLTDCNAIPESSLALLTNLDTLILDALRHKPHPTHFSVSQALVMAKRIGARQTYFTHIAHDLGHAATCAALPPGVTLAYDGLMLTFPAPAGAV
jgi:phosphoribosyl 1,2-cyclic phosphate phosphodiesterase